MNDIMRRVDDDRLQHVERKLDLVLVYLRVLAGAGRLTEEREEQMTKTLDDLLQQGTDTLAQVKKNTDLDDSIIGVVNANTKTIADLRTQLAAAGTDPAKLAALGDVMDALQSGELANGQAVADAVTANTGAAATT